MFFFTAPLLGSAPLFHVCCEDPYLIYLLTYKVLCSFSSHTYIHTGRLWPQAVLVLLRRHSLHTTQMWFHFVHTVKHNCVVLKLLRG